MKEEKIRVFKEALKSAVKDSLEPAESENGKKKITNFPRFLFMATLFKLQEEGIKLTDREREEMEEKMPEFLAEMRIEIKSSRFLKQMAQRKKEREREKEKRIRREMMRGARAADRRHRAVLGKDYH